MLKSLFVLVKKIDKIIGQDYTMYLYGSVGLKDFRHGWSDIDILCITNNDINDEQAKKLLNLRKDLKDEFADAEYVGLFEGVFLPKEALIDRLDTNIVYWGTKGEKIINNYSLDAFSRIDLIDNGILVCGKDIKELIKYPTKEEIYEVVNHHYLTIREHAVETKDNVYSAGWILDIARGLYLLEYGKVISKTEAGKWALKHNLGNKEVLNKVLQIRENPLEQIKKEEVKLWLCLLGKDIQEFADILESELKRYADQ